ncbi:hypothetical protein NC651_011864 [Populus alba x Populus x berolinensis]|nr:hypothetical protein NC651_011864 [Populus alba x Populus x berolinensis]
MENFTKKLDSTDVQRRLSLPENFLKDFQGDQEANLKFKDEEGQVWTFRCRGSPGGISKSRLRNQLQHIIKTSDQVSYVMT